jgi:NTP pyrophosphatase (non-canonical NTP hydrolase)
MSEIRELIEALVKFRDERDWAQFHDSKNLATAISIEAAELNEVFLCKEELADVFAYALLLAEKHKLDVKQIVLDKIARNAQKYPIEKAKGSAKKYDEL